MDADEYLQQRVENQITWYSTKATWNKHRYFALRTLELIAALSLPVLAAWGAINEEFPLELVVAVVGFAVASAAGLLTLAKFQENWLQYRTTAESLKHHKFRFQTQAPPYTEGNLGEFVNNVEALVSEENTNWAQYIADVDHEKA